MRTHKEISEEVRLAAQEMIWAAQHLANYYNAIKPADAPKMEIDPRQLTFQFYE